MGTSVSKAREETPAEVRKKFTSIEFDFIFKSFKDLAQRSPGNTIDKETFLRFFPLPGLHGERLFKAFDHKNAGVIDFEDFLTGLAVCSRGSFDEKVKLIFQIYDIDDNQHISKLELRTMLHQIPTQAILLMSATVGNDELRDELLNKSRNSALKSEVAMPVVNRLVEDAFSSFGLSLDDFLSPEQFKSWVRNTPEILNFLESACPLSKGINTVPSPCSSPSIESSRSRSTTAGSFVEPSTARRLVEKIMGNKPNAELTTHHSDMTILDSDEEIELNDSSLDPLLVYKCGYMHKVGRRTKALVKRYFILQGQVLYYYNNNRHQNPAGVIFLTRCFVAALEDEVKPKKTSSNTVSRLLSPRSRNSSSPMLLMPNSYGFELITSQGGERDSRIFYTRTMTEREDWIDAIRKASNVIPFRQRYVRLEKLGNGKFACVYKCKRISPLEVKMPEQFFAVKVISKNNLVPKERELLRTEIAILRLVNHPNIINMEDVFESLNHIYIVLELIHGGELFHRIVGHARLTEEESFTLVVQLLEAVHYLHVLGVAHRDIKPENILCTGPKDRPLNECTLKLCDFGLSKLVAPNGVMRVACGTLSYVAPEVLSLNGYGKAADIWSIGVILYLLRRGKLPFEGDSKSAVITNTICKKLDFLRDRVFSKSSPEHIRFIQGLLNKDPNYRLTAEQALVHPWVLRMKDARKLSVGPVNKMESPVYSGNLPPRIPTTKKKSVTGFVDGPPEQKHHNDVTVIPARLRDLLESNDDTEQTTEQVSENETVVASS